MVPITMKTPKSILITGAGSGIGKALATSYAAKGRTLFLGGRRTDRLEATAAICRRKGAAVHLQSIDVAEMAAMRDWIQACERKAPLDLVIANAGISGGTGGGGEEEEQARDIMATNIAGVLNTWYPALEGMRRRRRGQLALTASLAGYRGFPGAPAYSASKACVLAYAEAMRGELAGDGIAVNAICPGFVKSGITDANDFKMPLLMEASKAARIIRRGLERNRAIIAFPLRLRFAVWLLRCLPSGLVTRLLARLPKKT